MTKSKPKLQLVEETEEVNKSQICDLELESPEKELDESQTFDSDLLEWND